MEMKDYYKILGVDRQADDKEIKSAYRKLARENHPDLHNGDKEVERRFQDINEAYEVLSDADNRRQYDQLGSQWRQGGRTQPSESHYDFSEFENLFRAAGRERTRKRVSELHAELEISLSEAFNGTTRKLEIQTLLTCPECHGAGCTRCGGFGQIPHTQSVEVKIPAGSSEGSQVKVGDVLITILLRSHPDYEIKGRDLIRNLKVGLYQAVRGGQSKFRTLAGKEVSLKIPPESQNGRSFRLKGQGLPGSGQEASGDLYVRLDVVLPTELSERERQLFDELASLRPEDTLFVDR